MDAQALEIKAVSVIDRALAVVAVTDQRTCEIASEILTDAAMMTKEIEDFFRPLKEKAFAAHKAIVAAEKDKLAPLKRVREVLGPQVSTYLEVQETIRKQEEARLAKEIEDAKIAMAETAEATGNPAMADAILETPSYAPTLSAPRMEGVGTRKELKVEVFDKKAFLRSILNGVTPMDAVDVNESYLKTEYKRNGRSFPGVNFRWATGLTVSRK